VVTLEGSEKGDAKLISDTRNRVQRWSDPSWSAEPSKERHSTLIRHARNRQQRWSDSLSKRGIRKDVK